MNGTGANAANATNATLQFVTTQLNSIYGAGTYAYDTVTDPTDGSGLTGNGPSGLIYNTKTVQDLGAIAIGTVGSSGAARAPMLYHLAPVGDTADSFYMFVEHAKSGTGTTNESPQRGRSRPRCVPSAAALGPTCHIIYGGDFNTTSSSRGRLSNDDRGGSWPGQRRGQSGGQLDRLDGLQGIMTESATELQYRDDFQFVTGNVLNATSGLGLVPGSYTAFGNNGTTAFDGAGECRRQHGLERSAEPASDLERLDNGNRSFADSRRLHDRARAQSHSS